MRVEQIVRVENKKGVIVIVAVILRDAPESKIQRVAFADLLLVEPLVHLCPQLTRDPGSVVGAVIRHHKNIHQFARIGLVLDAANQVANHHAFVAGGNQHAVPVKDAGQILFLFIPLEKYNRDIDYLIQITHRQDDKDQQVNP